MRTPGPRQWMALAALTVVYVLGGKLGLLFASVHASATAVWPPTGIAIAALLLGGPRLWPGVLIGAFAANLTTTGGDPPAWADSIRRVTEFFDRTMR